MKRSLTLIAGMLLPLLSLQAQTQQSNILKIYLTIILFCCAYQGSAQPPDTSRIEYKRSFWGEGGAGTANGKLGITGCASVEVIRHIILSYEFDGSFDFNYIVGEPNETDTESRGFTLGYLGKSGQKLFYITAGMTRIRGVLRGDGSEQTYEVWSTKIRVGFLYSWEYVAIGVSPYVNLNSEILYGGITANLAFGRFIKLK